MSRTFAQRYCLVAGIVLVIAGLVGFIAGSSFKTGVAHLISGIVLLAAANARPTAKTMCWAFGAVYFIVFLWGLIDGNSVFGVFPVDPADNVLHVLLALAAWLCAYVSPTTKGQQRERRRTKLARRRSEDEDAERQAFIAETERESRP